MKPFLIILFVLALIATGTWFVALGTGRSNANNGDSVIFALVTVSMALLGETLLSKYTIVQRLARRRTLFRRRVTRERATVTTAQAQIIHVEKQGFGWVEQRDQIRSAHRIAKDHTIAERSPCAK